MTMRVFNLFKFSLLVIALTFLGGCGPKNDDLNEFMNTTKAQPGGKLEPLPELLPPESFTYSASGLRSPFQPPSRGEETNKHDNVPAPDLARPKEVLENFSMDQLSMVGTLQNENSKLWVLISAGGSDVYRVAEGNYLGRNYGKITKVDLDKIEVLEVVPDGRGGWLGRPRKLEIKER